MMFPSTDDLRCRCGHDQDKHKHYRRGSDCSRCACWRFRFSMEQTVRAVMRLLPSI